jgi:hypothetical protein
MNNKVDKLFKNKLEKHSLAPSQQVWEKVEARLSKKNKTIIWVRIAAALTLTVLTTITVTQWKDDAIISQPLATHTDSITQRKETLATAAKKDERVVAADSKKSIIKKRTYSIKKELIKKEGLMPKEETHVAIAEEEKLNTEFAISESPSPKVTNKKPMKITFSLPALEPKHEAMEQQVAITAPTPQVKKTNLQRAFDAAREIRTGEALESLREAKNHLFAKKTNHTNNNEHEQ